MNIKNNISSFSQDLFRPIKTNKEVESAQNIKNHTTSAYKLDISANGIKKMKMFEDEEMVLLNRDRLTYTKDLRIILKTI